MKLRLLLLSGLIVIIGVLAVACGGGGTATDSSTATPATTQEVAPEERVPPPSDTRIESVERELSEWGEGRWLSHSVSWSSQSEEVLLRAVAYADANSVAIAGYCDILNEISERFLLAYDVDARVTQSGRDTVCR